jgi:GT2 family glycosyltransferase
MTQSENTPAISCVIPTYNRGKLLSDTIEMLLDQTIDAEEILVIDQSTEISDDVRLRLQHWEMTESIRWLHQTEPNASMARNRGALAATGDVLLFLDDDIRIGRDFVEMHARNYLDPRVSAVSGRILEGDGGVVFERRKTSNNPELDWLYFPKNFGIRCTTTWMASGNFSIRRAIYFEVGGMDENYVKGAHREESDFALRLARRGYRFQFDPDASIYHLGRPGASKGGTLHDRWWNYFHAFVGHWYFTIGFGTLKTTGVYIIDGFRYFVFNKATLRRPWSVPARFAFWIAALFAAIRLRLQGARTLRNVLK